MDNEAQPSRHALAAKGGQPVFDHADRTGWRHAVVYQVHTRSFADDGDGISDIGGLRSRLPHPRDLKVDAIWLGL
jgi:alpha-glucosidase